MQASSLTLGRITTILLSLFVALGLHVSCSHLLRDMLPHAFTFTDSTNPNPSTFVSPAGREEVGRCFNFTSRPLDHYQVLDLPRDAPQDRIRPAYVALARVCHPDKLKGVMRWATANANFERLRLAYDTLQDELSRCMYECDVLLFDIFARTTREWQRCEECSMLEYLRWVAAEERSNNQKKKRREAKEQEQPMAGQGQDHERDDNEDEGGRAPRAQSRTVSIFVQSIVEEIGPVLKRYALQVVTKVRRCWVSFRDTTTTTAGQYASSATGRVHGFFEGVANVSLAQWILARVRLF